MPKKCTKFDEYSSEGFLCQWADNGQSYVCIHTHIHVYTYIHIYLPRIKLREGIINRARKADSLERCAVYLLSEKLQAGLKHYCVLWIEVRFKHEWGRIDFTQKENRTTKSLISPKPISLKSWNHPGNIFRKYFFFKLWSLIKDLLKFKNLIISLSKKNPK